MHYNECFNGYKHRIVEHEQANMCEIDTNFIRNEMGVRDERHHSALNDLCTLRGFQHFAL